MRFNYFKTIIENTNDLAYVSKSYNPEFDIIDIHLWESDPVADPNLLYVVSQMELKDFCKSISVSKCVYCCISDVEQPISDITNIEFISSSLSKAELWKKIRNSFHLIQHYDHLLVHAILNDCSLQTLLEKSCSYWESNFYLLNEGGQMILPAVFSARESSIDITQVLNTNINNLFDTGIPTQTDPLCVKLHNSFSGQYILLKKIISKMPTRWLLITGPKNIEIPIEYSQQLLVRLAIKYIEEQNIAEFDNSDTYSKKFGSILNLEITDPKEIGKIIFNGINDYSNYYFRFLLIAGKKGPLDAKNLNQIQRTLKKNLPNIQFVIYSGEILGIMTYPISEDIEHDIWIEPLWNKQKEKTTFWLRDYIKEKNCQCVLDEANTKLSTVRASWVILHELIRICRKIPEYNTKICIRGDLAKGYYLLESGYKYFYENVAQISPILLCNPSFVILSRYDEEHNTNLTEILYSYIKNNKNIEQTSKECFLHRNTIKNKIELIQSLINIDFNDSESFMMLVISYHLMRYYTNYMGGNYKTDSQQMK